MAYDSEVPEVALCHYDAEAAKKIITTHRIVYLSTNNQLTFIDAETSEVVQVGKEYEYYLRSICGNISVYQPLELAIAHPDLLVKLTNFSELAENDVFFQSSSDSKVWMQHHTAAEVKTFDVQGSQVDNQ